MHIEGSLDRLVQFFDFAGVTGAHQALQTLARHGEYVIEVRNAGNRQSLPAAEKHFGWELADGSRNQRDYDSTNVIENSIPGQDNDGSATDGWRQFSPPHLSTLHASSAFHLEISGSSPSSTA